MKLKHDHMNTIMFAPRDEDEQNINFNYNTMSDKLDKTGVITEILPIFKGVSKAGKDYQKQDFAIDTQSEFNNIVCFGVFGEEKIRDIISPFKVGDTVTVSFNVSSNRWAPEGKEVKYFTSLDAWKVNKVGAKVPAVTDIPVATEEDDLPF